MAPFVMPQSTANASTKYSLAGVVVHVGTLNGGQ